MASNFSLRDALAQGAVPELNKTDRSIESITTEILELKHTAGGAILGIGQRLIEAKTMLPHGEWLPWLTERVEFSERTANRFMRLAREWTNQTTLSDLGASKALALLALPVEERDRFMSQNHEVGGEEKAVIDMSARELEKAIKERKEALEAKEQAEAAAQIAEKARAKMEADMKVVSQLLEAANSEKAVTADQVSKLEAKIKAMEEAPVEVAVMEVDQAALDKARADAIAEMQEKLDKAKAAKAKAEEKRKEAEEALAVATAKLEDAARAEKKAVLSNDKDLATFEVLFQQGQELANKMAGVLIKLRGRDDQSAASGVQRAMKALSDAIGRAAE